MSNPDTDPTPSPTPDAAPEATDASSDAPSPAPADAAAEAPRDADAEVEAADDADADADVKADASADADTGAAVANARLSVRARSPYAYKSVSKRGRVHPLKLGAVTLGLEGLSALIVILSATQRPDMATGVYVTGYILGALGLWIYHMAYQFRNGLLQWFALITKVCFAAMIGFVLWDIHRPRRIWEADGFGVTESHHLLLVGAVLYVSAAGVMVLHAVFLGRGRRDAWIRFKPVRPNRAARRKRKAASDAS